MTLDDLFDRSIPVPVTGCWLWEGPIHPDGYGLVYSDGRTEGVHRVAVRKAGREIPIGMQVDHLCRVRCCINPTHLEVVSHAENIRRGETGLASGKTKRALTHCKSGHPFIPGNYSLTPAGHRRCLICHRQRENARYHSKEKGHGIR